MSKPSCGRRPRYSAVAAPPDLGKETVRSLGRGSLKFVPCENRRVIAYVREYQDQKVLVVNNLSATAQPAELDLRNYPDVIPVELLGKQPFPRVSNQPYFLSLGPRSFFWFRLEK